MVSRSRRQGTRVALLSALVVLTVATSFIGAARSEALAGTRGERAATSRHAADGKACHDVATDVGGASTKLCLVAAPGPADTLPLGYESGLVPSVASIQYGPDPAQLLDLYLPAVTPAPVLVFFHAGGWVSGARANVSPAMLHEVRRGYAVVSVEYRLAPQVQFPVPLQDAKTAIRWVKAYGPQFGLRADEVFATGSSAGAHLAAMVATTPSLFEPVNLPARLARQNSRVVAAVSMVGPLDLGALGGETGTWGPGLVSSLLGCPVPRDDAPAWCVADAMAAASPDQYVTLDDPPIYLCYGGQDVLVPAGTNGLPMASRYAQLGRGREAPYDVVDNQGHNVDLDGINITMLDRFLDQNLQGPPRRGRSSL
jgi:acetyl esterase/lipase